MQGNVQSIDALRDLRIAVNELALRFGELSFDIRNEAQRALEWTTVEVPRYWRHEFKLAERRLQEAVDNLAAMQATYGGRDKPPATEAKKRIAKLRRRVQFCQQRLAVCKSWAAEMERSVGLLVAATSTLQQQSEADLPVAATKLQGWIDSLDRYVDGAPP